MGNEVSTAYPCIFGASYRPTINATNSCISSTTHNNSLLGEPPIGAPKKYRVSFDKCWGSSRPEVILATGLISGQWPLHGTKEKGFGCDTNHTDKVRDNWIKWIKYIVSFTRNETYKSDEQRHC